MADDKQTEVSRRDFVALSIAAGVAAAARSASGAEMPVSRSILPEKERTTRSRSTVKMPSAIESRT